MRSSEIECHGGGSPPHRMADTVAEQALRGLLARQKWLPTWLLYDEAGGELFERITALPEYYLGRAETEILSRWSDDIVGSIADDDGKVTLAELGAGAATKTEVLVESALRSGRQVEYLACDIAPAPLLAAEARLRSRFPEVTVRTFVGTHREAGPAIGALSGRQSVLFLGSSIGNYADAAAAALLAEARRHLRHGATFLVGTDLKKDPRQLQSAYDDSAGVTAAFTLNVLDRLNRELGCSFRRGAFRHVAEWDEATSNVVLSLEATTSQRVALGALGTEVAFRAGERVRIEICAKYDDARVDGIFEEAGLSRLRSFVDDGGRYAVHAAELA